LLKAFVIGFYSNQYLFFYKSLPDFSAVEKYLAKAISEYNSVKPHSALAGLTSDDAFCGQRPDKPRLKACFKEAIMRRIRENSLQVCANHV